MERVKAFHNIRYYKKYRKEHFTEQALSVLESNGIQLADYHHCFYDEDNEYFVAYVWDTREVQVCKKLDFLDWFKVKPKRSSVKDNAKPISFFWIEDKNITTSVIQFLSIDMSKCPLKPVRSPKPTGLAKVTHIPSISVYVKKSWVATVYPDRIQICCKSIESNGWAWKNIVNRYSNIEYGFDYLCFSWDLIMAKFDVYFKQD